MKDILYLDDVKKVVDCFYDKVRNDEQLKDVFNNVIQDRWPAHLEKMYRFWQTVLLDEHPGLGRRLHDGLAIRKRNGFAIENESLAHASSPNSSLMIWAPGSSRPVICRAAASA